MDKPTTASGKTYTYVCACGKTVSAMASGRHYRKCEQAQAEARKTAATKEA